MNKQIVKEYYNESYNSYIDYPISMNYLHFHNLREFDFVNTGSSEIVTECGTFKVEAPFVVQYPEGMLHLQRNTGSVYTRWHLLYPPDRVQSVFGDRIPGGFVLLKVGHDLAERIKYLFNYIVDDRLNPNGSNEHWFFPFCAICNELMPNFDSGIKSEGTSSSQKRIFDICRYIDAHFAEKMTLDSLSGEFFIGRATLVREFRRVLDTTVGDYIQHVRVSKAKRMLMMGKSVSEVSDACGYASPSYFIQVFRRSEKITPAVYAMKNSNFTDESWEILP